MGSQKLEAVAEEKDLGVLFTVDLKPPSQCQQAYPNASKVLAVIQRVITYIDVLQVATVIQITIVMQSTSVLSGRYTTQRTNNYSKEYSTNLQEWYHA